MKMVFLSPEGLVARKSSVVYQFWRAQISLEGAQAARSLCTEVAAEGRPFGLYIENEPKLKPPAGKVREVLLEIGTRAFGCSGCAFVSKGGGFMSAVHRAAMASMTTIARTPFDVDVSKGPEEGIGWLADQLNQDARSLLDDRRQLLKAWDIALSLQAPTETETEPIAAAPLPVTGRALAEQAFTKDRPAAPLPPSPPAFASRKPTRTVPTDLKDAFQPRDRKTR